MERKSRDSKLTLLQLIILWTAAVFFFKHPAPSAAQNLTEYRVESPVIVPSGTTMTIENSRITIDPSINDCGFSLSENATLTIKNSILDMSKLPWSGMVKCAIDAKSNSTLIFDNTEVSGANAECPIGFINCYGCSMSIKNGSKIRNNFNTGWDLRETGGYRGNIIYINAGSLTVEDSSITDNQIRSALMDNNSTWGIIGVEGWAEDGANVTFKDSVISGNYYERGAFVTLSKNCELNIENTLIENNQGEEFGFISAVNGKKIIIDEGTVFRGNRSKNGSCIYTQNTTVEIKDNTEFTENITRNSGGVIFTQGSNITIGKSTFKNNKSSSLAGGAIYQEGTGILTLNSTIFTGNEAFQRGGAIYIYGENSAILEINDAEFKENTGIGGGGINLASSAEAVIHKAVFNDNTARNDAGGALIIEENAKATISNLLISRNTAALSGGAIANGNLLFIHNRKGALIFDNIAGQSPDGFQDVYITSEIGTEFHSLDDRMLNGGKYNWRIKDQPDSGIALLGISPTNENIEGVSVVMTGNKTLSEKDGYGGAIANAGTLIIGEESVSFPVRKIFLSPDEPGSFHSDPQAFADALIILADGMPYELGPARQLEKEDLGDGKTRYLFSYTEDVSVYLDLIDNGDNSFDLTAGGLPVGNDGTDIVYTVDEAMDGYTSSITGNMTDGFTITNVIIPTPTPTQVPTEVPTLTPPPQPGMNFYRLPEMLESLPGTGF